MSANEPGTLLLEFCQSSTTSEGLHNVDVSFDSSENEKLNYLDKWEDQDCKLLMVCWSDHKHLFGGKTRKKDIFEKIAKAFNEKSKRIVSGEQCMRKWNKMVTRQKEIQDHNNKSGNDRKTWKYYEELSQCLSEEASINPVCTMESSLEVQNDNHLEDEELDGNTSDPDSTSNVGCSFLTSKKEKKRCRKRPASRSSATEMLKFLKGYCEKREKTKEEKLTQLREMKEEKQQFYNRFFDLMKKD